MYYKHLNLNIPVLNDLAPLDVLEKTYHTDISQQCDMFFHPEFLDFIKFKNVYIMFAESFFSVPGVTQDQDIHTDCDSGDYIKINYVIGGRLSSMHWYQVKPNIHVKPLLTEIGTEYLGFEKEQVYQISSTHVRFSIVQVGIPHNISNPLENRLCISLSIAHIGNHQRLTMADAVEIFSEYITNS